MATSKRSGALSVSQPKNDNVGPGSQAKSYTKLGYPDAGHDCVPNTPDQKVKEPRSHQGLYA